MSVRSTPWPLPSAAIVPLLSMLIVPVKVPVPVTRIASLAEWITPPVSLVTDTVSAPEKLATSIARVAVPLIVPLLSTEKVPPLRPLATWMPLLAPVTVPVLVSANDDEPLAGALAGASMAVAPVLSIVPAFDSTTPPAVAATDSSQVTGVPLVLRVWPLVMV